MRKIAVILLGLVVVILLISLVLSKCDKVVAPPVTAKAQYIVHAGNRYYYTNRYTEGSDLYGKWIMLNGYWDTTDGKTWTPHNQNLKLSYFSYPNITISLRP